MAFLSFQEKKQKGIDNQEEACEESKDETPILRPLNMEDMRHAKDLVSLITLSCSSLLLCSLFGTIKFCKIETFYFLN